MTMAPPTCNCESPLRDLFPDRGCPIHGTKATHDRLVQAERMRDRYREALRKIAAGPNDAPHSEPWSRAGALIALDEEHGSRG